MLLCLLISTSRANGGKMFQEYIFTDVPSLIQEVLDWKGTALQSHVKWDMKKYNRKPISYCPLTWMKSRFYLWIPKNKGLWVHWFLNPFKWIQRFRQFQSTKNLYRLDVIEKAYSFSKGTCKIISTSLIAECFQSSHYLKIMWHWTKGKSFSIFPLSRLLLLVSVIKIWAIFQTHGQWINNVFTLLYVWHHSAFSKSMLRLRKSWHCQYSMWVCTCYNNVILYALMLLVMARQSWKRGSINRQLHFWPLNDPLLKLCLNMHTCFEYA